MTTDKLIEFLSKYPGCEVMGSWEGILTPICGVYAVKPRDGKPTEIHLDVDQDEPAFYKRHGELDEVLYSSTSAAPEMIDL